MSSRLVTIYATCGLTLSLAQVDQVFVKDQITQALFNDGWNVISVSVTNNLSLTSPNTFQIIIQANVDNAYSDEYARQQAARVLSNLLMHTDYGVFNTLPYKMFSSVYVQIVTNRVQNSITETTPQNIADSENVVKNLGLDNFLTGAGFSSPIVLGLGLLLLIWYVKK